MSNIQEQLAADMKEAMKNRDQMALGAIRGLKTAFMNACVEKGLGPQGMLPDADAVAVVRKQIKQRQDSVESFRSADRAELAEKEEAEIRVLEKYLPAALTAEQVEQLVDEAIAESGATSKKEMGAVMKLLQERAAGRVDGKTLSAAVGRRLA
ncbi:MAG: GatB/YqeY domain-containing protein [Verrucomicrobiales bacterium]|nr:GatB/YqeY domain-containing protein [Verrucomicrobiales bacterium]